jgi:uncharacterized surface protein with fasciclin (FAS1) repeats
MKFNRYFLLFLLLMAACVKEPVVTPVVIGDDRPLMTILKNNYNFSMFCSAVQRTGLDKTLESDGPFTLLVPDNNAFALSGISVDSLQRIDTATLGKLLRYHIIPGRVNYAAIPQAINFAYQTLAALPVYFSVPIPGPKQFQDLTANLLHINGVAVNKNDIQARNGIIHALNNVLYYPAASIQEVLEKDPQYSYFVHGLKAFDMWDQLGKAGSFTVLAPTNEMFDQYGVNEADLIPGNYKSRMLSPYILAGQHFFISDLKDAPLDNYKQPGIVTAEFILVPDCYNINYGIYPFNYRYIQELNWAPPYYGNAYVYGPVQNFINTDHEAGNGVVHGLSGLVMIPDSARIQ